MDGAAECRASGIGYLPDADGNGSGQQAAQCLSRRLRERGITVRLVSLPEGHDPNSFFVQGGSARQFQSRLDAAKDFTACLDQAPCL